jgi:MFS family permease
MFLIESIVKVYQLYGYKVFLYPLSCALIGGILWFWIANYLTNILWLISFAFLIGLLSVCISKSFSLESSIWHSIILGVIVILCYLLTLWAGLYFGAYFIPIAIGNIVFSILFFLLDYFLSGKKLEMSAVGLYLISALIAILIFYAITILDWKKNVQLYNITYPLVAYIYLQTSLLCRLMFK